MQICKTLANLLERIFSELKASIPLQPYPGLYCLALQPVLNRFQEFPSCFIVAYCDDVQIVGPPADAARALERYSVLLHEILQQELRPDKTTVFAPSYSIAALRAAPLFSPFDHPRRKNPL